jgi:hypothetical protein
MQTCTISSNTTVQFCITNMHHIEVGCFTIKKSFVPWRPKLFTTIAVFYVQLLRFSWDHNSCDPPLALVVCSRVYHIYAVLLITIMTCVLVYINCEKVRDYNLRKNIKRHIIWDIMVLVWCEAIEPPLHLFVGFPPIFRHSSPSEIIQNCFVLSCLHVQLSTSCKNMLFALEMKLLLHGRCPFIMVTKSFTSVSSDCGGS